MKFVVLNWIKVDVLLILIMENLEVKKGVVKVMVMVLIKELVIIKMLVVLVVIMVMLEVLVL